MKIIQIVGGLYLPFKLLIGPVVHKGYVVTGEYTRQLAKSINFKTATKLTK